jgi:hypothetical protein
MKLFSFVLIIAGSLLFNKANAQILQVDSVAIRHCFYRNNSLSYYGSQIDSFFIGGLIYNSSEFDASGNIKAKTIYTYSPTQKLLHKIVGEFVISAFQINREDIFQYNSGDSMTLQITFTYSYSGSTQYISGYEYEHLYNQSLLQDTIVTRNYNSSTAAFDDNHMNILTHDQLGKILRGDSYYPYTSASQIHSQTNWYSYLPNDSLNFILQKTYNSTGNCDSTINKYKYDASGYQLSTQNNCWNSVDSAFSWEKLRTTNYYDSNNNLLARANAWFFHPYGWEIEDSTWYSYDSQNRQVDGGSYSYPHGGSSTHITYDALLGNIDSLNTCSWGTSTINCSSCKLEYHLIPVGVSENSNGNIFTVFPNPAGSRIQISLSPSENKNVSITIRDIQSKALYSKNVEVASSIITLDDTNLSSGLYFITLSKNGVSSTRKLIIQ